MKKNIVKLLSITSVCFIGMSVHAMGLKESIQTALTNNSKSETLDLRIQAMQERNKAHRLDLLPSLSFSSSTNYSRSEMNGVPGTYTSKGHSESISTSVNLYNGGSDIHSINAAAARLRATDAQYNSSNAFIPNSRGGFANSVFGAYMGLVNNYEMQKFFTELSQTYISLKKAQLTSDELSLIEQKINGLHASMVDIDFNISQSQKDYTYYTTASAPALQDLENLEQMMQSLVIPGSAEEAIQVALVTSPDIKAVEENLVASKESRQAEKGRLFRPRIDLYGSVNRGGDAKGAYVGISMSYNLGASQYFNNSASRKELAAAQSERDATIDEIKYELNSTYPRLANLQKVYQLQIQNLASVEKSLAEIYKKIETGQAIDLKATLDLINARTSYWMNLLEQKQRIVSTRFNIQRSIGTLFEGNTSSL